MSSAQFASGSTPSYDLRTSVSTTGVVTLVGSDPALLEGIAQTLGSAGFEAALGPTIPDAIDALGERHPVVLVVERSLASHHVARVPLQRGGAIVVFDAGQRGAPLSGTLSRLVLAELELPLERQRLVALVQHVATRVAATGGNDRSAPKHPVAL